MACATCGSTTRGPLALCAAGKHARCGSCRDLPLWRGSCPACVVATVEGLCPVCLDSPVGPYFQCRSGHAMCGACHARMPAPGACPQCREPLSLDRPIRALLAEQAAAVADAVPCARCGLPSSRGGHWEHACTPVLRRLLSRVYTTHTAYFRGTEGEEVEVKRSRGDDWRGAPRLLKCVYADREEHYEGAAGREVRVRVQCEGREWHYDATSGLLTHEETAEERIEYDPTRGHKIHVEFRRGHANYLERWKLAPDGKPVEKRFLPPHRLNGQTHHLKDGVHVRTTLDTGHPQAGETWHFEEGNHVCTTFAPWHERHGQVAHILHQRHVFTTFEPPHSRAGDAVFFDGSTRVHASFCARTDGTLHEWARREARGRCLACERQLCPCLRFALCLDCYQLSKAALAPAAAGAQEPPGPEDVVVAVSAHGGLRAGSRGVVESRHDTSGLLHARFCVCAARGGARDSKGSSLYLCVADANGPSSEARARDAACVAHAPRRTSARRA